MRPCSRSGCSEEQRVKFKGPQDTMASGLPGERWCRKEQRVKFKGTRIQWHQGYQERESVGRKAGNSRNKTCQ